MICFALQAAKLFYLCQQSPVHSSCRTDSVCLSSSLVPSYFTSNQTAHPLQSLLFLICPCCLVGNKFHRTRLCCNELAEGAGMGRAFAGWLNLSQCLPWQSFGSLILATMTFGLKFNKPDQNCSPLGWLANKKRFSYSNALYWYKWIVTWALENVLQHLHPLMLFNPWMLGVGSSCFYSRTLTLLSEPIFPFILIWAWNGPSGQTNNLLRCCGAVILSLANKLANKSPFW